MKRILHECYSTVFFDSPYLEEWPNGPRYRNRDRDEGMRILRHIWWREFGTAIPKPIDS
jgi:hypothetical protein